MKVSEFIKSKKKTKRNKDIDLYYEFINILTNPEHWINIISHIDKIKFIITFKYYIDNRYNINFTDDAIETFFNLRNKYINTIYDNTTESILLGEHVFYLPSQNDLSNQMRVIITRIMAINPYSIEISTDQPVIDIDEFFDDLKNILCEELTKIMKITEEELNDKSK